MIEVLSIPPLATVQDLGRRGYWADGLATAGVMDVRAHCAANFLLGNTADAATLEIPLTPARFQIVEDGAIALAGAACDARLDGVALSRNWSGRVVKGQVLTLGAMTDGARVYLALPGGIDVPERLGSRSTQIREGFGGFSGRVLAAGDRLTGRSVAVSRVGVLCCVLPDVRDRASGDIVLRALPSAETAQFSATARAAFFSQAYRVTAQSNRQGCRLEGPELDRVTKGELRSHGIAPGIVQVPGGGQPIIQLADAATMGGYPKIACVIEEDLWKIGQARPGDRLRFEQVDLLTARDIAADTVLEMERLQQGLCHARALQEGWVSHV